MAPTTFPQANGTIGAPDGVDESQVAPLSCYRGELQGGNMDGSQVVTVAWQPNESDIAALNSGAPVFLSCFGGLPPHIISTVFPFKSA